MSSSLQCLASVPNHTLRSWFCRIKASKRPYKPSGSSSSISIGITARHECKNKSKITFAQFQSNERLQNRIAVLQGSSCNKVTDSQTQANLFSIVFTLSYRSDDGAQPPPFYRDAVQMDPIFISHNVVESALNTNKGVGPNSLRPRILDALAYFISAFLTYLVILTPETGEIPEDWREATICPIFKKGCKETLGIYRPLSLTSIVYMMMEAFLRSSLMKHQQRTANFANAQNGFVPKISCLTNLLSTE